VHPCSSVVEILYANVELWRGALAPLSSSVLMELYFKEITVASRPLQE